jgi:hypothetical protein
MHPGDPQASAVTLQVGSHRFVLAATNGDSFFSAAGDGGKIVAAMLKAASLTLQVEGGGSKPYRSEFPGVSEGLRGPRTALPRACRTLSAAASRYSFVSDADRRRRRHQRMICAQTTLT